MAAMESGVFAKFGRMAAAGRWWVIIVTIVFVVFAGIWGRGAFGRLTGGAGFDDPGSESTRADQLLAGALGRYAADVVVLYESKNLSVDDAAFADSIQKALSAVPQNSVVRMQSYWSTGDKSFVSGDRHSTYVTVQLLSNDEQGRVRQFKQIKDSFKVEGLSVRFGGLTPMTEQVNAQTGKDIALAESLSIPLMLILLVIIFRSAVAASIPLAIGAIVAVGSFAVLRTLTAFVDISTFSINVITMLGLGLAIDYALFTVNRFREELAFGRTVDEAVQRAMGTAGRTVAFSGLTVAVSLACLIVFPSRFLSSMGYSGMAAVLFAVVSTLFVMPALLRFAGHRVNSLRVSWPGRSKTAMVTDRGKWYQVAHAVMRRPWTHTVGIVLILLALGLPFLGVNWARPGDWVLPVDADARAVTDQLRTKFHADPARIVTVVVQMQETSSSAGAQSALQNYARRLNTVQGINGASVTGTYDNLARLTLGYTMDPQSREASRMVKELRALTPPPGATAFMTGMPASRVDIVNMIVSRLPWMCLFVGFVSFVVLFLAFGSVVLPIKSVVMNLLSLSASFGAIKLIFQDGYLQGLLNFVPVGAVDVNFPVLIVAIAFGLSMDYEVFLLSRVKEEWDRSQDPAESVALGLQRTAKIITSAALLLIVVVGGFITSGITFMKMIGVGLVIAIAVDVTIVRALLVPATMRLLGKWAWWAPGPLARWWQRYGVRESDAVENRFDYKPNGL